MSTEQSNSSSSSSSSTLREARSLAQKLFGQCRDIDSTYKALAPSIRKLRNVLEELEEVSLDSDAAWMNGARFALQIESCRSLLVELDLTLQSHRCSTHKWQDVLQQTITRLQKSISTSTANLAAIYEAILDPTEQQDLLAGDVEGLSLDQGADPVRDVAEDQGDAGQSVEAQPSRTLHQPVQSTTEAMGQSAEADASGVEETVAAEPIRQTIEHPTTQEESPIANLDDSPKSVTIHDDSSIRSSAASSTAGTVTDSTLELLPQEEEQAKADVERTPEPSVETSGYPVESSEYAMTESKRVAGENSVASLDSTAHSLAPATTTSEQSVSPAQTTADQVESLSEHRDLSVQTTADQVESISEQRDLPAQSTAGQVESLSEQSDLPAQTIANQVEPTSEQSDSPAQTTAEQVETSSEKNSPAHATADRVEPISEQSDSPARTIAHQVESTPEKTDPPAQMTADRVITTPEQSGPPAQTTVHQATPEQSDSPVQTTSDRMESIPERSGAQAQTSAHQATPAQTTAHQVESVPEHSSPAQTTMETLSGPSDSGLAEQALQEAKAPAGDVPFNTGDRISEDVEKQVLVENLPEALLTGDRISEDAEKQVVVEDLPETLSAGADCDYVLDWRSPFAMLDPLSVDIESASSFLLGSSGQSFVSPSPPSRRESSQNVQVTKEEYFSTRSGDGNTFQQSHSRQSSNQITGLGINLPSGSNEMLNTVLPTQEPAAAGSANSTEPQRTDPACDIDAEIRESASIDGPVIQESQARSGADVSHLRPTWVSSRPVSLPTQKTIVSDVPKNRFSIQHQLRRVGRRTKSWTSDPSRVDSKTDLNGLVTLQTASSVAGAQQGTVEHVMPHTAAGQESIASRTQSPARTHRASSSMASRGSANSLLATPPPAPTRTAPQAPGDSLLDVDAPLPPSLPPRTYQVTNPSPPSIRSTTSDDLYSSSRPPSPNRLAFTESVPRIEIQSDDSQQSEQQSTVARPPSSSAKDRTLSGPGVSNALEHSANHTAGHERRSADGHLSSRYFRVELDEPGSEGMRARSMSDIPRPATADIFRAQPSGSLVSLGGASTSSIFSADDERLQRLCWHWHNQQWDTVELWLHTQMDSFKEQGLHHSVRRVRHLYGVCASFQGHWQRALGHFIAALSVPIRNINGLDQGDFAALYWLGDTYALLNRRTEALVAYSLASHINARLNLTRPAIAMLLYNDQATLLQGMNLRNLDLDWNRYQTGSGVTDSILEHSVIDLSMINMCLGSVPQGQPSSHQEANVSNRASRLCVLEGYTKHMKDYLALDLTPRSFDADKPWPVRYDPFFAIANVAQGRLCDQTTNLLTVLCTEPMFKVAKNGPVGTGRLECFTCNQLDWLIVATRQCLTFLDMQWDEAANPLGSWFVARFNMKSKHVSSNNFFAISLFKQSMLMGYGVEVCVDGVRSARVMNSSVEYVNGVHHSCEKRLRKLVRDYLAHAYKLWVKDGKKPVNEGLSYVVPASLKAQAANLIEASPKLAQQHEPSGMVYG